MRYAEVLLSYLEAVNESQPNAVDQNLLDLTINDIRDRVKLVGIKRQTIATQELVREAVRKERRGTGIRGASDIMTCYVGALPRKNLIIHLPE